MSTENAISAPALRGGEIELRNDASAHQKSPVAALYDQHAPGLYAYVLAITADETDAEDIVHEVFERALARRQRLFGLRNPAAYMYRAARNAAYDRSRRRAVRERAKARIEAPPVLEPVDPLALEEQSREINRALATLSVDQREVVLLRFYQDLTFHQIGRIMGSSANTAASRCRYALAKLRKSLGDKDDEQY